MKKSILLTLLMLLTVSFAVQAQFEGTIAFQNYVIEGEERESHDSFTLYLTGDRILLRGGNSYDLMGPIQASGILIRLDREDIVFLNDEETALAVSKSDITSMMNMFGNGEAGSSDEPEVLYEKTGETKELMGHTVEKYLFRDDEEDNYTHVWMVSDLDINWGMLAEPWGESAQQMVSGDIPIGEIFRKNLFPLQVEFFSGGELRSVTEATQIDRSTVSRSLMQVPDGVKILSLQDYLFQQMSRQ